MIEMIFIVLYLIGSVLGFGLTKHAFSEPFAYIALDEVRSINTLAVVGGVLSWVGVATTLLINWASHYKNGLRYKNITAEECYSVIRQESGLEQAEIWRIRRRL